MDYSRHTSFPDLRSSLTTTADNQTSSQTLAPEPLQKEDTKLVTKSWTLGCACPPVEDLIFAWASVLHWYTSEDEPVFSVDGEVIKVDVAAGGTAKVIVDQTPSQGSCPTGIVTRPDYASCTPLYVQVTSSNGICICITSAAVSQERLPEIGEALTVSIGHGRQQLGWHPRWRAQNGLQLSVLNPSPKCLDGSMSLHCLFEKHASEAACALDYLDSDGARHVYSYQALNELAEALAVRLQDVLFTYGGRRATEQDIIPILVPQSPELYIAILAVLKVGAAFCPLDPDAPRERTEFIVGDLSATVVIADTIFADRFFWKGAPEVILAGEASGQTKEHSKHRLNTSGCQPSSLAYVMYTSGSTGTPKGVEVSHFAVTQSLLAHDTKIPRFSRFLQFAAPTFDVFIFEVFFPFSRGATLISCNRKDLLGDLPSVINQMGVDATVLTPTVASGLIRKREHVPDLKLLMTIGEMLKRTIIEEFGDSPSRPGILYGMYGPTEAAIHCTIASKMHVKSKVGIIGQPLETVSALILAPNQLGESMLNILPVGHIGELAVGGFQLASGYLNRPEQTRAVFIESQEYGRIYRTGDRARLLPDGNLECLGRISTDQVKLRGHRLELGEVEEAACRVAEVNSAIASVIDGILVVFCLVTSSVTSVKSILEALKRWLPGPLIPGDVVLLREVPRLPSGKVDKKRLQSGYKTTTLQSFTIATPSEYTTDASVSSDHLTSEERSVRIVLSNLSGIEPSKIQRSSTIFQLGLDSVCAVQIAADLRKKGWNISAVDVLQFTSVRQLIAFLNSSVVTEKRKHPNFDFGAFDRQHRSTIYSRLQLSKSRMLRIRPCTAVQSGMIAQFVKSDGNLYLSHIVMELVLDANLERIQRAWEVVARRYEMLRTGFISTSDLQYPFAMLEHSPGAKHIPWDEKNVDCTDENTIKEVERQAGLNILEDLHEPAWRIIVMRDDSRAIIQYVALHALFDAQSLHGIVTDVGKVYAGQSSSPVSSIEPVLGIILSSSKENIEAQKQFWQAPDRVTLADKFPNMTPNRSQSHGHRTLSRLCSWSRTQLEAACSDGGFTLSAAGQAAWSRILSAYVGQDMVAFGLVLSARTIIEVARETAFPCVTTLPLSCRVQGSNVDLVMRIMDANSKIAKHQFTSLRDLQKWAGHGRDALFDTIFAYQKFTAVDTDTRVPWRVVEESVTVDYAISVELEPLPEDHILLRLAFQEHVLPFEQAELLLEQLDVTIINTVSCREASCTDFSIFPSGILSVTPAKERNLPSSINLLHDFVNKHARVSPQRVALEFAVDLGSTKATKDEWTYAELLLQGNRVAHLLNARGVYPGDLVAICFEKCPQAYFAILGILKAGCAFLALDPDSPVARKTFIVSDSSAKIVLTLGRLGPELQRSLQIPVISLDLEGLLQSFPSSEPTLKRLPHKDDICYCLYTSGTTGTPKGCDISHENAVQAILSFQRLFADRWDDRSRWLQFASFHFDVSVLEMFWSWSVGICVTSAPKDLLLQDICKAIQLLEITHIDLTPSLANLVDPRNVPLLCDGVFITGGELLKQEIIDIWGPYQCIYNAYGPTEATIGVTANPRVPVNGKPSNIGFQFDNVGTFVLEPNTSNPVLRGAVGEICISGALVGKGYRNRPDLTKQRFQVLEEYYEKIYRTGDLVRLLYNGTFDFIGRADNQVKLRGQRLEIAEINEVVKQSVKTVKEVATLVLKHPTQKKEQLVAFVSTQQSLNKSMATQVKQGVENDEIVSTIKSSCRARLPTYGVPTHIIPLDSMPLSANNKVDTKYLKEIYSQLSLRELQRLSNTIACKERGCSVQEKKVAELLANSLGIESKEISMTSTIYELGHDSLSIIGFASTLGREGFTCATPFVVANNPVVRQLAKALSSQDGGFLSISTSQLAARRRISAFFQKHAYHICRMWGLPLESIDGIAPCTPLQEGMITTSLQSSNALYFSAFYFKLSPQTNVDRLQGAWSRVVHHCQILRTVFCMTDDGYAQVALKLLELPWVETETIPVHTVEHTKNTRFRDWHQQNTGTFRRPFEIVVIHTTCTSIICIHIFHALYDGNSFPVMLQKVSQEYKQEGNVTYGPSFQDILPLGPLCVPEGAREFWLQHLEGTQFKTAPLSGPSQMGTASEAVLEVKDTTTLEHFRRKHGTTYQAIIQACWISVLRKRSKSDSTVGVVVSGKSINTDSTGHTIGPIFNTIPFLLRFNSSEEWTSIIRRCHTFNTAVLPYQHTALRDITKWCSLSTNEALFDTLFVFNRTVEHDLHHDTELWTIMSSVSQAHYSLAFEANLQPDGRLVCTIVAQIGSSYESGVQELLREFSKALHDVSTETENILDIPFPREQLLNGDNERAQSTDSPAKHTISTASNFEWSPEALQIRDEVAALANIEESCVDEQASVLELGLDSIDAIKLSSRLRRKGVILSLSEIMKGLTIAGMARISSVHSVPESEDQYMKKLSADAGQFRSHLAKMSTDLEDIDEVLPVTGMQEAMLTAMLNFEGTNYFNVDVLRVKETTNVEQLLDALDILVSSTPILRTSFVEIEDPTIPSTYVQLVHRQRLDLWHTEKLSADDDLWSVIATIKRQGRRALLRKPFQLTLLEQSGNKYIILSIAHALYDGWSLSLLHEDIQRAYYGIYSARPSYRPVLGHIIYSTSDEARQFWKSQLSCVKGTPFPRQGNLIGSGGQLHHRTEYMSKTSTASMHAFCRAQNITLQTLGQACWSFILSFYTKQLEVVFGAVLACRDTEIAGEVVFPTMNTVIIRSILHGTRKDMLRYMSELSTNIRQHQHLPLRVAQSFATVQGEQLFNTLFIVQKNPPSTLDSQDRLYESIGGFSSLEYPVCVEMEVVGNNLVWRAASEGSTLDSDGLDRLLRQIDYVLNGIIDKINLPAVEVTEVGISVCGLPPFSPDLSLPLETLNEVHHGDKRVSEDIEWSDVEVSVRKVLALASKIPETDITKDESMFHLGLDSISAIKVSALLRKESIQLSVSELLRASTVRKIALLATQKSTGPDITNPVGKCAISLGIEDSKIQHILTAVRIAPKDVETVLPATAGQVYMLSMWQNTEGALFDSTFEYKAEAMLDELQLRAAWAALLRQCPILRSTFVVTGQRSVPVVQVVLNEGEKQVTWGDDDVEVVQSGIPNHIVPLPRLFAHHSSESTVLKLQIMHTLYDAVSLPLLISHLRSLYNYPEKRVQDQQGLEDYLAYTQSHSTLPAQRDFWCEYLSGSTSTLAPTNKPRNSPGEIIRTEVFRPALLPAAFDLGAAARRNGLTAQGIFLAAYARVYSAFLHQAEPKLDPSTVVFGVYIANRFDPIPGLSTLAAPTLNLVPLKVRASTETSLRVTASQVQRDLQDIGTTQNAAVSLWEIDEWTGIKLNSFVNFLRLPVTETEFGEDETDDGDGLGTHKSKGMVTFKPVEPAWENGHRREVALPTTKFVEPEALKQNAVRESYLPSLDIEASIVDGALNVGIFGPAALITLEEADRLMKDLREELVRFCEGTEK